MLRRSLQNISMSNDLESAKLKVSSLLKKRKKVSTLLKSFEIDRLSQMLKLEVSPSEFQISGEKLDRSQTQPHQRFPKLKIQTQRRVMNEEEQVVQEIETPKIQMDKNLSKTLKRVLRSKKPCQHSISSYYPAVNVPDHFSIVCNLQKMKSKIKGFGEFTQNTENRGKRQSIKLLTESSPLMRSKSVTLQFQEMKKYFEQKYCKNK